MPVSWVYDGLGFREDIAIQPPSQWFLFPLRHLQASWTGRMEMETGTLSCGVPSATGGWWCLMQPAGPCNTAAFKWDCCLWYVTHSHKTHSTHQRHCSLGRGGCSSLTLHWDCSAQCTTHALSQVLDWKKGLERKNLHSNKILDLRTCNPCRGPCSHRLPRSLWSTAVSWLAVMSSRTGEHVLC